MPISYGFLSTYPPTRCGLAAFTSGLLRSLVTAESGDRAGVVRVLDAPQRSPAPEVIGCLQTRARGSHRVAAQSLNQFDVAMIQHDYGIFGGDDGDQLLAVLDDVQVPIIMVVHTVLANPTRHQRDVLARAADASGAVVATTHAARDRLVARYDIEPAKVVVIPYGAAGRGAGGGRTATAPGGRPLLLTWGLLKPGMGIEWVIDALQHLRQLQPRPGYIVAGQTHPRVRQQQGEAYRLHLTQRARAVGVSDLVRFAATYLDDASLAGLIHRADVIVLPYDSREQASSGVLVEAVAAGKPVVATAFPHAQELLSGGAGVLVPQQDGAAMGAALYDVLANPSVARSMAAEATRLAPTFLWSAIAERYRRLACELLASRATSQIGQP